MLLIERFFPISLHPFSPARSYEKCFSYKIILCRVCLKLTPATNTAKQLHQSSTDLSALKAIYSPTSQLSHKYRCV